MLGLAPGTATVANWATNGFDPPCESGFRATYVRGVDIAPDSSWFVVATTGGANAGTLCDSASRWELPPRAAGPDVQPTWVTWTGSDTHWSAEITGEAVYVGGHQRWENSVDPWDGKAPGRVSRPGIAALDPTSGVPLSWNPGRDRGRGVEAMLATDDHLFVGSDTVLFAGVVRQRLAVLPYAGGTRNLPPEPRPLPVTWHVGMTDGTLRALRYDGAAFGPSSTVSGPAIDGEDWRTVRDAFVQRGQLVYFGPNSAYFRRPYDGASFGTATNLSTTVGYLGTNNPTLYNQPYNVGAVTNAGISNGWLYYTHSNDSRLWSRGYSNDSGIIGGHEIVSSHANWSGARAIDVVGDWLYAAWSDGKLYRFHLDGREVEFGTRTVVDDGSATGINWATVGALFSTSAAGSGFPPPTPVVPAPPTCSGTTPWAAQYFASPSVSGVPATARCEVSIAYNYGAGAPSGTAVGPDNFAARWTRRYSLAAPATLVATATGIDDGIRVSVDGVRIIDAWRTTAGNRTGRTATLAVGVHTVVVDYFEGTGNARADVAISEAAPPPPPDVTAPDTAVTSPARNAAVPAGPVAFGGTATDDRSVTGVFAGLRNTVSGQWLQADGSWGVAFAERPATLTSPGAASTGWNITVSLSAGSYAINARARDAGGNFDPSPANSPFRVT